jgi:hypothetical protein
MYGTGISLVPTSSAPWPPRQGRKMKGKLRRMQREPTRCHDFLRPNTLHISPAGDFGYGLQTLNFKNNSVATGMFIPDQNFFHPGSIGPKIPGSGIRNKEFKYFHPKIVSKLSEIWSGMFIADPGLDFLPIPDLGVKKAWDPGFATLKNNWFF